MYTQKEVMAFVEQEDVKFIRLAFCDVFGRQKNISIMPGELPKAFEEGISFNASGIDGFGDEARSDLFLRPDPSTLAILPWRPTHGRVVRMFCDIYTSEGEHFECDGRYLLQKAVEEAKAMGISLNFGAEYEFYLFKTDEKGEPTRIPFDNVGYLDIFPEDRGENVRRDICLTLSEMGIQPEHSHHEEGPGQYEVSFRYAGPLQTADNATTFKAVVKTIAVRNGLWADFSPKPLPDNFGNGLHINISVNESAGAAVSESFMAGILEKARELTLFLNPHRDSYARLGEKRAPRYIAWGPENRSQLIRIPAAKGVQKRFELRSPDPEANPYLAFTLLIMAGLEGVKKGLKAPEPVDVNLFHAGEGVIGKLQTLPGSLYEARELAAKSELIERVLPEKIRRAYHLI